MHHEARRCSSIATVLLDPYVTLGSKGCALLRDLVPLGLFDRGKLARGAPIEQQVGSLSIVSCHSADSQFNARQGRIRRTINRR